jgi:hypothetical protein
MFNAISAKRIKMNITVQYLMPTNEKAPEGI